MADYALDDAAMAALWSIRNASREHVGLLYGDPVQRTPAVKGRESTTKGAFTIPTGSLRALFHNHTPEGSRAEFSKDDKMQAKHLRVPSYISAGEKVYRYDPATGRVEEVLGMFPIGELLRELK